MTLKYLKPLAPLSLAFLAGCASNQLKFEDEIQRDGCFSETYRMWTKGDEKIGKERIKSTWSNNCKVETEKEERKRISYKILTKRAGVEIDSPQQETVATRKILAAISYDNPDLFIAKSELTNENITVDNLLEREVDSLFQRITSTDYEDSTKASGEIVSIYEGKRYPLHTETARTIINASLKQYGMQLQDIKNQYLNKQEDIEPSVTIKKNADGNFSIFGLKLNL